MSKRVFIGVGHGGVDPGAVGYVKEADANLNIALELKKQLEAAGLTVGISRTKDENDDINEEIREANAFGPDLAVEVHNNAGGGNGWECFVQTNGYAAQSRACAQAIEAEVKAMGQQSRGIKTNTFGWIRLVNAPSVLLEGFFVDNKADATDFDTLAEQQALGRAYARGVLKYLGMSTDTVKEGAAPAEQPKPAVTPTAKTTCRVQVGAYAKKANADAQLAAVKKAGFSAFMVQVDGKYKIQVGAFNDRANANAQMAKVKAAGFSAFITTKSGTTVSTTTKKSVEEIAKEVKWGKWGNGIERKNRLEAAGYDYNEVQAAVNRMY